MLSSDVLLSWIPEKRIEGLHTSAVEDEVLVYDLRSQNLHALNAVSSAVWEAIDGTRSVQAIQQQLTSSHALAEADVVLALQQLSEASLLTNELPSAVSRRSVLRKAAIGAVAIPAVVSLSAPLAASAASGTQPTRPTKPL